MSNLLYSKQRAHMRFFRKNYTAGAADFFGQSGGQRFFKDRPFAVGLTSDESAVFDDFRIRILEPP
jgi:hypothetical protein